MEADNANPFNEQLQEQVAELLARSRYAEKAFVLSGQTFQDVYEMAAGLRSSLSACLKDENTPVCLCSENKAGIAAAILASLAGGPSLIFPYAHSPQVLHEVHTLTGATLAITDTPEEIAPFSHTVSLDRCRDNPSVLADGLPVALDRTFLGLYTGGSTGAPALWSKTVRNLFSEAFYLSDKFGVLPEDRIVPTVSPYHIYGLLFSVLLPLVSSASVLGEICTFPHEIVSALENHQATVFVSVPMHYRVLKGHGFAPPLLKWAFSSAGVLDENDGRYFHEQTGRGVIEIYGSTETGGIATRCRAMGEEAFNAFDHIAWKIDNEHLCVRSDFVSPEMERDNDGFVRTNDRARPHDHRRFLLLGRSDAVTKVGGKRVNLDEIKSKLMEVPGIRDCVVISLPVQGGRENAIAALVEGDVPGPVLKKHLAGVLEPYAIPRSVKVVKKMLYTATGKYDGNAIERMFRKEFQ